MDAVRHEIKLTVIFKTAKTGRRREAGCEMDDEPKEAPKDTYKHPRARISKNALMRQPGSQLIAWLK